MDTVGNIANYIRDFEDSIHETVNAVVIGYEIWYGKAEYPENYTLLNETNTRKVIGRDEALCVLDVDYEAGYGGTDCPPVYAYTDNWIMVIHEYDGSTRWGCIERNPIDDCNPIFMGGG